MRKDSCNLEIDGSGGNMVIRGVATVVLQDYRGWTDRKERCCKFLEVTMLLEDGSRGNLDQVLLRDGGEMAVVGRKCWNRRQQQRVRWQKKVEGEAGEKGEITAGSIIRGVSLQRSIVWIPLERRTLYLLHLLHPDLEYRDI
ncbi:hypothetical protein GW17_00041135 [Ensete ventricosum]|nr:hypothetical protein GW17_00041135 [Ensete ventricosum]